ncbi:MAG: hypothetical protein ACFHX7_16945 [Pseudomonadota bacterium]
MSDTRPRNPLLAAGMKHRIRDMNAKPPLSQAEKDRLGVIYPGMENIEILNIYRDLRNKLLRLSEYNNFVCLISSIGQEDESSLLALNLAAVFAFDRSRSSIVIDCDTTVELLDLLTSESAEGRGLIDFIESDQEDIGELLHDSGIERLRIVPSGSHTETRTETFESERMRQIIMELKARYPDRYLFINAPSMRLSSEVQILSNVSDFVIFQITAGDVTEQQITEAIEMIGAEKVAGVVLRET